MVVQISRFGGTCTSNFELSTWLALANYILSVSVQSDSIQLW